MKNFAKQATVLIIAVCSTVTVFAGNTTSASKNTKTKSSNLRTDRLPLSKRKDLKFKNIEFDLNKASIRQSSYSELDKVINALQQNKASLNIAGHADSRGTYVYNWNLSKARAESVKKYIVDKGYDQSRIAATEFGDTKPIASNKTPNGRQKNRRVELAVY